jgi:hypothetical protein
MAKRQFPPFYEKAIPVALVIIGLLVVGLLVIIAIVFSGQ